MQASRKGLAINYEKDSSLPDIIYADESRLEQILVNLLISAVKYTSKGSITLKISRDPQDPNSIQFTVADTGIGMNRELLQILFEAFTIDNKTELLDEKVDQSN